MSRLRVTSDQLRRLLDGEVIEIEHRATRIPRSGATVPLVLHEDVAESAQIIGSRLADPARARRQTSSGRARPPIERFRVRIILNTAAEPLLLRAESQAAIAQLPESVSPAAAEAHGLTPIPEQAIMDAGEAMPADEIPTYAHSQQARAGYALQNADALTKRRIRSLANRARDALMQARARGVDPGPAMDRIEAVLEELSEAGRRAA